MAYGTDTARLGFRTDDISARVNAVRDADIRKEQREQKRVYCSAMMEEYGQSPGALNFARYIYYSIKETFLRRSENEMRGLKKFLPSFR